MYADDTNLAYSGSDINTIQFHLNEDLENINEWLISNKLTLNMTKTEYMLIGSRQRLSTLSDNPSFEINGIPLDRVSTTKSLGVLLDENLTWSSHINKMTKRIASGIGAIKRLRSFVSLETLHVIYQALIQLYNHILIIVMSCGEIVGKLYLTNFKNFKTVQCGC